MRVLIVYGRLYAECFRQAMNGLKKNAWTLLLPAVLSIALDESSALIDQLRVPFVGGLLLTLFMGALASCYLYFVGEVVSHAKVSVNEMGRSIGAYFWSIINLGFVLWIAELLAGTLLRGMPNGGLLLQGLKWVALILLSAAPEAIYQRGTYGGLATVQKSISFLQQHWIEWLLPSAVFVLLLWELPVLPFFTEALLKGAIVHLAMVFRGHLFAALDGSTHRQRMFKYRGSRAA